MKKKIFFALVCLFIAAVSGRCDRNAISACFTSWDQSGDIQTQCATYETIKKCIAPHKDVCAGDPTLSGIASFEQMCNGSMPNIPNGCAIPKLMTCVQMLSNLVTEDFEGYPSSQQIITFCPKFKSVEDCVSQIKTKCDDINTAQAQQIIKGIEAAVSLTDLMCGAEFKAGFLKHGMECFDKTSLKNATRDKCASMTAPKPEPESSFPSPESKARECQRTTSMFECYAQQVEAECGDEAVMFFKKLEGRYMNSILGNLGCQTSGNVRLAAQPSASLFFLLAAFFMY